MKRERRSGQLPIDFLVGFTIFILSLIMVANYVPSLLVGLQRTSGIDYDAVAYRTGVVLVEDPGEPPGIFPVGSSPPPVPPPHPQWDLQTYGEREFVNRFGLALSRDTPNILSINKIERFFNSSYANPAAFFFNDTDYRNKLLFSSYQYGYNVTLQNISPMKASEYPAGLTKMLGDPYPAGYGYIRRYVVIKQNSNATINLDTFGSDQSPPTPNAFIAQNESQVDLHYVVGDDPHQQFVVRLDHGALYNKSIDNHLKIDLQREPLSIRITNFSSTLNNTALNTRVTNLLPHIANSTADWACLASGGCSADYIATYCDDLPGMVCVPPESATLIDVQFGDPNFDPNAWTTFMRGVNLTIDNDPGKSSSTLGFPLPIDVEVENSIELYLPYIEPFYLNDGRTLDVTFVFQNRLPHTHVTGTFLYDYNTRNVTQPVLSTGMVEVAIW